MQHIILIDPNSPRLQRITDSNRASQITRVHCGCETVGCGVADADGIVFGFEFGDGADGAEDFFLHYLHVFAYVGEDGGLDEVAFVAVAFAADFYFGAFFFAGVDVAGVFLANV